LDRDSYVFGETRGITMPALIIAVLFIACAFVAVRKIAACPLLRTIAISARCWSESAQRREEAA
jgi:hypothetical protein